MKACFQIFKAPFYFVGWLAPAVNIFRIDEIAIKKMKL